MENENQEKAFREFNEIFRNEFETEFQWRGRNIDWLLQQLVEWTNQNGLAIPLTLYTPSGIISGILIPHQKYFELFADEFAGSWMGDSQGELRDMIAKFGTPPDNPAPQQFIHLEKAECFGSDGKSVPKGGMLWRGKISSVTGFNLGRFTAA